MKETTVVWKDGILTWTKKEASEMTDEEVEKEPKLLNDLTYTLQNHVSETGESEGAKEVLERLIKELEYYRELFNITKGR